ncbi:hypothetical protein ISF_06275 [Cordyceps fumosorosea ARSEF 2679]|uniref:Uncharacterized protein n=1 Tax=Cordyceps fumosorosea (strain ARSEF 2679) TaxID=1081104 RepID=A0A167S7J8_CORFA|nr:hypothetical protein ISF_06275 [Cordyceps fumosorosea ARSEF 2679]OAA59340.1 hypothetical protein ISF_06275 [Cordyceps fumosorosea ARSEF 2679]
MTTTTTTMLSLPLVPRSPSRAVLQILLCALLLRARPDLLPPWHHILPILLLLLLLLAIAISILLAHRHPSSFPPLLLLLEDPTPSTPPPSPPPPPQWKWAMPGSPLCRLAAARLQPCTRALAEALRRAAAALRAGVLFCVAAGVHALAGRVRGVDPGGSASGSPG